MLERLLGRAFREGGSSAGEGRGVKARCRLGSLVATAASRSGSRRIPRAPEVNGVRACVAG